MSQSDIIECVKSIKVKNCEGYDRIPQRILVDGIDHLAKPLTHLLSSSANALKICSPYYDYTMSFDFLHKINERATPHKFMLYKHAIELHKLFNLQQPPLDWMALNFDQATSRRQTHFTTLSSNNYKIGNNILSNRLSILNGRINLEWLNLTLNSFKIKCKKLLL